MRIDFQEFVEQRAIVDHRLPHLFGGGLAALPARREHAGGTVILNDHWMIHGQIGGTPIELFKRIAPRRYHLRDQLIGLADRAIRVVDEARLNAPPFAGKRAGLFMSELVQVEVTDTLGARAQNLVCTGGTDSLNGSFVLGSKTLPQVDPLPAAAVRPRRKHEQQHNNTHPDQH